MGASNLGGVLFSQISCPCESRQNKLHTKINRFTVDSEKGIPWKQGHHSNYKV